MSAELVLYPRLMWSPDGVEVAVNTVEQEAECLSQGYRLTPDPVAEPVAEVPPPDPENEPPTFGAADDDTFAASDDDKPKKAAKKK